MHPYLQYFCVYICVIYTFRYWLFGKMGCGSGFVSILIFEACFAHSLVSHCMGCDPLSSLSLPHVTTQYFIPFLLSPSPLILFLSSLAPIFPIEVTFMLFLDLSQCQALQQACRPHLLPPCLVPCPM